MGKQTERRAPALEDFSGIFYKEAIIIRGFEWECWNARMLNPPMKIKNGMSQSHFVNLSGTSKTSCVAFTGRLTA